MNKLEFTYILFFLAHGLPSSSALSGDFIRTSLATMLCESLLDVIPSLTNVEQEGRRCRLLGYLEGIQASRFVAWQRLFFWRWLLVLLWELVHFIFHVGEVGQLIL